MEMAARPVIVRAINTRHVFVYARVNGGSGVTPLVYDTRRHMGPGGFVSPAFGLWLLRNRAAGAVVTMPARLIT